MSILKGRRVCIFLFHSLYEVAGSDLLDVSGKRLFLFSKQDLFHFGSSYPISQSNPQLKSNVFQFSQNNFRVMSVSNVFRAVIAGRIDRWVDVMVEGGLRPYWVKKTMHFNALKNIHSKRIQDAGNGKDKQGVVLDRSMFGYPLLIACGGLLGSAFVWFVELTWFHREEFILCLMYGMRVCRWCARWPKC